MTKPVILTGLRANNELTLGNYFGGMLPIIEMATQRSDDYQINMFIPDLHSFTTPIDHALLQDQIMNNARLYAAAGLPLDNDNIHLYRQSYVPAHSELTWILDCFTGYGEMRRMTQFKDKATVKEISEAFFTAMFESDELKEFAEFASELSDVNAKNKMNDLIRKYAVLDASVGMTDRVSVGLFNYPVLMSSDILLYGAQYVPVGDDQSQHLEFTRNIAERMNSKFGDLFVVPKSVAKQHEFFGKGQGLRIKDLADPAKKMSKSDESGKGVVFLSDDPEIAAKKVMSATTDDKAYVRLDRDNQPGISNLLEILALLRGHSLTDIVHEFEGQDKYGDFKKVVATELKDFLTEFQAKLASVDDVKILAKLEISEKAMNQQANQTLLRVQQAVGLRGKVN